MTMHKALHVRDDVDTQYVLRKEGGRGFVSVEDGVDASIQRLEDFTEKRGGRPITTTRNNFDNTRSNLREKARKQNWREKELYRRFKQLTREDVDVAKMETLREKLNLF